jgi:transposase
MTIELEFTSEIIEEINYERYHHPVPLVQRRMEVLWLKSNGLSHALIAQLGRISENTMREYFRLYEQGGVAKLREVNFYHPQSQLNVHISSLEEYFKEHPVATIKEAQSKIKELTGIERSETQIREFFKKNSISVAGKLQ